MAARGSTRAVAGLVAALAALGLAACGGGGDSTSTSTAPQAAREGAATMGKAVPRGKGANAVVGGKRKGAGGETTGREGAGKEGREGAHHVDLSTDPAKIRGARVTSTGAVQTLSPSAKDQAIAQHNSYASIRAFGAEAEGSEETDITFALLQYLSAKAEGDWPTACARLYSVLRESLERQPRARGKGCPELFAELMRRAPQSALAEQAKIDVSSVRRGSGNRAFVIYKTPATLSADMPMYLEGGVWKVGAIEAYALRPGEGG